jgi:outer membrane putative beta-barrel porin/alpha-amylase
MMRAALSFCLSLLVAEPAFAGPPYVSDDPEPTDYRHFEIYTFNTGTSTRNGTDGETGIDVNYGGGTDLQLTATLPLGFSFPTADNTQFGLSNVELAAKYRFLHQATFGWDVAVFPRIFLPSASTAVGDREASVLLPIWAQRDLGNGWTTFGGGGCQLYADSSRDSCIAGWVLTRQVLPNLQLGAELFHQSATSLMPASTSVGMGAIYDVNKTFHLLGYLRTGIQNQNETDHVSWYTAILFTF